MDEINQKGRTDVINHLNEMAKILTDSLGIVQARHYLYTLDLLMELLKDGEQE